jgi:hypothetical protein
MMWLIGTHSTKALNVAKTDWQTLLWRNLTSSAVVDKYACESKYKHLKNPVQ